MFMFSNMGISLTTIYPKVVIFKHFYPNMKVMSKQSCLIESVTGTQHLSPAFPHDLQ